jgi:hypothetical protein
VLARVPERLDELVLPERRQDESASRGMSSAVSEPLAPNVWKKRRSSPTTDRATVFEVPWPGVRSNPDVSMSRSPR